MTPPNLPPPGTATEMYLAAVLGELRGIRDRLDAGMSRPSAEQDQVELTEPAPPSAAAVSRPTRKTGQAAGVRTRKKD